MPAQHGEREEKNIIKGIIWSVEIKYIYQQVHIPWNPKIAWVLILDVNRFGGGVSFRWVAFIWYKESGRKILSTRNFYFQVRPHDPQLRGPARPAMGQEYHPAPSLNEQHLEGTDTARLSPHTFYHRDSNTTSLRNLGARAWQLQAAGWLQVLGKRGYAWLCPCPSL